MSTAIYGRKKILLAVPAPLLEKLDAITTEQNCTRSEFVRQAIRSAVDQYQKRNDAPSAAAAAMVTELRRLLAPTDVQPTQ